MGIRNIEADCFALVVFIAMYIRQCHIKKDETNNRAEAFISALLLSIVGTVVVIFANAAMSITSNELLFEISAMLRGIVLAAAPYIWLCCSVSVIFGKDKSKSKCYYALAAIPCAVVAVLAATNPLTGIMFSLSEGMQFKKGVLFIPALLGAIVLYIILNTSVVLVNKKKIEQKSTVTVLVALTVATGIGAALQLFCPALSSTFPLCAIASIYAGIVMEEERRKLLCKKLMEKDDKLAAEAARADSENAEKAAKAAFLSRMCRNMRTTLSGMLDVAADMTQNQTPDSVMESAVKIHVSGRHLLTLINNTLDINEIESDSLVLHPVITDAIQLSDNIDRVVRLLADDMGVSYSVEKINPQKLTPVLLCLDSFRVEQIFLKLITNAIRYTPAGGSVRLTVERLETTKDFILNQYEFIDTGIGMSDDFMKHMYEPFSRENRATEGPENGEGLSLAVVQRLVSLMGGELHVKSEVGKGTTFSLIIRFRRYTGSDKAFKPADTQSIRFGGANILLCEDHPVNREIAVKLLESKGASVACAEDGSDGVRQFAESDNGQFDLILMDVRMPKMDGFEATKTIRMLHRPDASTVPIIAMTADAFDEDVEDCYKAGMNAHISKPLDVDGMYVTVDRFISHNVIF